MTLFDNLWHGSGPVGASHFLTSPFHPDIDQLCRFNLFCIFNQTFYSEIIIEICAVVRENTAVSLVPFAQFPPVVTRGGVIL